MIIFSPPCQQTIESMYVLWKVTGNSKWRERGWEIFKSLEREAKLGSGYASLRSVQTSPASLKDEMPRYGSQPSHPIHWLLTYCSRSYFLAET